MATPRDSRVEEALRRTATDVACVARGAWTLSLGNGAVVPARARVVDGWLEMRADLPTWAPRHDDVSWLRFNARLDGSVRVAHVLGSRVPHLRADAHIEHEPDLGDLVTSTCLELTDALHATVGPHDDRSPLSLEPLASPMADADVERACAEAGWPCVVVAGTRPRVDIETRAGLFTAVLESSPAGTERAVVELMDLGGQLSVCRDAVAAFLMAVSGSVRSVKSALRDRDGANLAVLVSPVAGVQSLDRVFSALAVACQLAGREVQALGGERLASEYLALWDRAGEDVSHTTMEECTCLQQL
jgi:hypothetical protein